MELQFSITILLRFFTAGWYAVTKGNSLSAVLRFADCVSLKGCLFTCLFLRALGCENALSFFLWPSSLRFPTSFLGVCRGSHKTRRIQRRELFNKLFLSFLCPIQKAIAVFTVKAYFAKVSLNKLYFIFY